MEPYGLTIAEAVRFSGIARTRLYMLASEGRIELKKCGWRTIVLADDLKRLLETLPAADIHLTPHRAAPADAA